MRRVFVAVAVLLLVSSSAKAELNLANIQAVYPSFSERKTLDYFEKDIVLFRYEVRGVKPNSHNEVELDTTVKLVDEGKGTLGQQIMPTLKFPALFGSDSVANFAGIQLDGKVRPGHYTAIVTVRDNVASKTTTFQRDITVKPVEFAIACVNFSRDEDNKIRAAARATVFEPLYLRVNMIGFDCSQGYFDFKMKVDVLDAETKKSLGAPVETTKRLQFDSGKAPKTACMGGPLPLTRRTFRVARGSNRSRVEQDSAH